MERVSIIKGKKPVIFVSPHSLDDKNTDFIAKEAAESMNAYAVINNGWKKSKDHDYFEEKADCNKISHCEEDVVLQEFLQPILAFKNRILRKHKNCYVFIIHGIGNWINDEYDDLDLIVGTGKDELVQMWGMKSRPYCTFVPWKRELFMWLMENEADRIPYHGITKYAGRHKNNLNQIFKTQKYQDRNVLSMQIEVNYDERRNKIDAGLFGDALGFCTDKFLTLIKNAKDFDSQNMKIRKI